MTRTIPLVQHIFRRLQELQCYSIHGVPGDFFLRALNHLAPAATSSRIRWIGCTNELCAGYAADGYARGAHHHTAIQRRRSGPRVGALLTTYGVGELSAINAIAGSYAESIPVVHLVGTPSREAWRQKSALRPVHHTLGDGRMEVYSEMAKLVTCAQTQFQDFEDPNEAVRAFDRTLERCVLESKPIYASIPSDMIEAPVDEVSEELCVVSSPSTASAEVEAILETSLRPLVMDNVGPGKRALVIADGLSYPFGFHREANDLAKYLPSACFTAGKGIIDEEAPYWRGPLSPSMRGVEGVLDIVVILGPMLSDTNTSAWTAIPDAHWTVHVNKDTVAIYNRDHHNGLEPYEVCPTPGKLALQTITKWLSQTPPHASPAALLMRNKPLQSQPQPQPLSSPPNPTAITQDAFWALLSIFLRPHDTLLLANGTPLLGGRALHLPPSTQVIATSIWASIGQMLPCAQGVVLAKRDADLAGRTILFEGDGSFQVTCQALSDIIRNRLDVVVFNVNNGGYTYERWLQGMREEYNDVAAWRYSKVARVFGAEEGGGVGTGYPVFTTVVKTEIELMEVLGREAVRNGRGLTFIDVKMAPDDVPEKAKAGLLKASEKLRPYH